MASRILLRIVSTHKLLSENGQPLLLLPLLLLPLLEHKSNHHRQHGMSSRELQVYCLGLPCMLTYLKGRVRTKTVKKSAKVIIERYYPKLTLDFETNKRICDEIAIIASKRLRNKVSKSFPPVPVFGLSASRICQSNTTASLDCRLHHTFNEAHPARSRPWYLVQATRRRA